MEKIIKVDTDKKIRPIKVDDGLEWLSNFYAEHEDEYDSSVFPYEHDIFTGLYVIKEGRENEIPDFVKEYMEKYNKQHIEGRAKLKEYIRTHFGDF